MVEGKIVNVSEPGHARRRDGAHDSVRVKVQRADLKPGATVKASFEEQGGQKVVTAIVVEPTK
jgi:hypothetical protein